MPKLLFTKGLYLPNYLGYDSNGDSIRFNDQEVKIITDETAKYLLESIPENFKIIKDKPKKKAVKKPPTDKMLRKSTTKSVK